MNITVYIDGDDLTISDLPEDLVSMMLSLGTILKTSDCDNPNGDDLCG